MSSSSTRAGGAGSLAAGRRCLAARGARSLRGSSAGGGLVALQGQAGAEGRQHQLDICGLGVVACVGGVGWMGVVCVCVWVGVGGGGWGVGGGGGAGGGGVGWRRSTNRGPPPP